METLKDPALLAEAQKGTLAINPVSPQEFYDRIKELQDLPPDLKKKLKETLAG